MKSQKHDDNTTRIAVLENTAGHIHETLERIEKRLDLMNEKIENGFIESNRRINDLDNKMSKGFTETNNRIDKVNDRLWSNFLWLLGIIIGGFVGITGFVAHALHWI